MPNHGLLAWIEPKEDRYTAALVTAAAEHRLPATRDCGSVEEAKAWIEGEAAALRVPVIWTDPPRA
jgi:NADPH-dependent ferric siderophore reductase